MTTHQTSNIKLIESPKLKSFLSRLAFVFAQFIKAKCLDENEDIVGAALTGDAPATYE